MNLQSLIFDLAFILLLGAIVTVLFKWIKQPVVLGYIVAGFLASPHFVYLPSVTTEANIEFWAQIGIIVLLFTLGLEFSFRKLVNSGGSAVVTALIIVSGMMFVGYIIGHLLGFTSINSLFLGGMLSMSSTTIIIKAFNDLGLRQKKFTSLVLAVLIVEDLFAVVMMVVLSSIAINKTVDGDKMLASVSKLVFFLVMWFLVGVYVIPSLLRACRRFLNSETLLVVSMGLCLGMAVFSVYCGFSLALGAFVMGSILAGTIYAERIEHVVTPVKDLFGAVFFISVGMMVQPTIIVQYWWPILLLSVVVICGMILFGTAGMLITGQSLKVAIQSGFSLTQIGEFAFIIATLGMSLGVLNHDIYPIVVAVSVITTFTTPFFIKLSEPVYLFVEHHLPQPLHFLINRYRTETNTESGRTGYWATVLKRYIWRIVVYSIILIAITLVSRHLLKPWLDQVVPEWSSLIYLAVTISAMAPFLIALIIPVSQRFTSSGKPLPLAPRIVIQVFRVAIAIGFVMHVVASAYSMGIGVSVAVALVLVFCMVLSRRVRRQAKRLESNFLDNLNERDLRRYGKKNNLISDLHLAYMTLGRGCPFAGERLRNTGVRRDYGVNIVSVQRDDLIIPLPSAETRVYPGDTIGVIGNDEQISKLLPIVESDADPARQGADASIMADEIRLSAVQLDENSQLVGSTPLSSSLRNTYGVLVVAVQRGDRYIDTDPHLTFQVGDVLWLVGNSRKINELN